MRMKSRRSFARFASAENEYDQYQEAKGEFIDAINRAEGAAAEVADAADALLYAANSLTDSSEDWEEEDWDSYEEAHDEAVDVIEFIRDAKHYQISCMRDDAEALISETDSWS